MGAEIANRLAVRQRHIYALMFARGRVYVGQSINPRQRIQAHSCQSGGWGEPFDAAVLETITGNVWAANRREFAWRWCAARAGLQVYSHPRAFFDDLSAIVWPDVKLCGEVLQWPSST